MACRNHPQVVSGLEHCYRCGFEFCSDCCVEFQGKPHCAPCKAEAVGLLETGHGDTSHGDELPPWERRQQLGMATAFWETIKAAMLDPAKFFSRMDTSVTSWDCLAIPCILSVLGAIVSAIVNIAVMGLLSGVVSQQAGGQGPDPSQMFMGQMFGGTFGACIGVVIAPIAAVVMAFIFGGLIHLYLMMSSNVRLPYQQTVRGYCYAQAPNILAVIPLLGGLVALFWTIWTQVVMVKELHRTSWGTAWISVLWYIVVLCLGCGGVYALIIAAAVAAQQGG